MPKKRMVYLDTSVISALFDERTPDRKALTESAWDTLVQYDVYISEMVIEELNAAPEHLREKYLAKVANFTILPITKEADELAAKYVNEGIFPEKYYDDALHVAVASVNDIEYLLSWNFKHLVKVKTRRLVSLVNSTEDYSIVEIIAPPEL